MRRKSVFKLGFAGAVFGLALTFSALTAGEKIAFPRTIPDKRCSLSQEYFFSVIITTDGKSVATQEKTKVFWLIVPKTDSADMENQTLTLSVRRVSFQANVTGDPHPPMFDTDFMSDAAGTIRSVYQKLQEIEITVVFDSSGNVVQISGTDTIPEMLDQAAGDDADEKMFVGILKNLFNPDTIREMFAQMSYLVPDEAKEVGDQWVKETEIILPVVGKSKITWNTEFKSYHNTAATAQAVLAGRSVIKLDDATNIDTNIEAVYDKATGWNTDFTTKAVVSKTENIEQDGKQHVVKTVGMTREIQRLYH